MLKRSQIALFLIFSLTLVIAAGFVYYIKTNIFNEKSEYQTQFGVDASSIKFYIQECLKKTAKISLLGIGKHGGYYKLGLYSLLNKNYQVPYYIYGWQNISPSRRQIEEQIQQSVIAEIEDCYKNFSDIRKLGFNLSRKEEIIIATIDKDDVNIRLNPNIYFSRGDKGLSTSYFAASIQIPFDKIIKINEEIVKWQIEKPNSVCISCIYELAERNNLYIDIVRYYDALVFEIRDYNITEDTIIKKPFNFTFAIKLNNFSCSNVYGPEDEIFVQRCADEVIEKISEVDVAAILKARAGEPFYYKIKLPANYHAEDYTEIFDIKPDGTIQFIPSKEHIGNHSIWIGIKDYKGNKDFRNLMLEVLE